MNLESFRRASQLFELVCDLPAAERSARLSQECGSDKGLHVLVEELLRTDREAERRAKERLQD